MLDHELAQVVELVDVVENRPHLAAFEIGQGQAQQVLTAGQQVEYAQGLAGAVQGVDSENRLAWRQGWLNYYKAPLADVVQGRFKRIQFTPDLVPADLVGTRIYNQKTGDFSTALGPVFANLLLADEINRAPAKVQSALLEVMQERQVTIAGETHRVPNPFLVMATQNPIETEGTYPLPEAQVDRFMMKVLVGYPTEEEEFVIAQRALDVPVQVLPVATTAQLAALQAECRTVYVDPSLLQHAVKLVAATRVPAKHGLKDLVGFIACGASPRATIALAEGAQALAMLRGRNYVLPEDMTDLTADVLRHRIALSYEALSEGLDADALVKRIMAKIPAPARPLHHEQKVA